MNRKLVLLALTVFATLSLSGCGGQTDAAQAFQAAQLDDAGNIVIEKAAVTETATFLNYDCDGVTVQLLAVRASDGTVRLAYNTCQSCNPSPKAYFVEQDGVFICQNCGNRYQADEIGLDGFGCNPTTVDGVTETDETITIAKESVESNAYKFTNWQGPTE